MQTCLKTLHQKHDLELNIHSTDRVHEVTYDEDGLALAVDPPSAPAPAQETKPKSRRDPYSDIGFRNTVQISAGAAHGLVCAATEQAACPVPEMTATKAVESPLPVKPEPTAIAAPSDQQTTSFQTLTPKSKDKSPVFKHLPKPPKLSPLFSNNCMPPDVADSLQIALDGPSAWNPTLTRSILKVLMETE
jgi:hypothetical protein